MSARANPRAVDPDGPFRKGPAGGRRERANETLRRGSGLTGWRYDRSPGWWTALRRGLGLRV